MRLRFAELEEERLEKERKLEETRASRGVELERMKLDAEIEGRIRQVG